MVRNGLEQVAGIAHFVLAEFATEVAKQVETHQAQQLTAHAKTFEARLAAETQAFEARLLQLYEQIRLARQRMFGRRSESHAGQALAFIAKLYAIEKVYRDTAPTARHQARQTQSRAVLTEFRTWLDDVRHTVPPKNALGQALAYLDKHWSRLVRYLERGDLPIDNNVAENAIRPFVVGRKAWLFSDTQAGANASALIYSLVETAKTNGLEPYLWLRNVLRQLPKATTVEHVEALLPWNQKPADLATE